MRKTISNRVLSACEKICFRFGLKNNSKDMILYFRNLYHLSNIFCNLVSLQLFNNNRIFHYNKQKTLYNIKFQKILAQARY